MFGTRLSMPDYPSYIFSISFVFLNSLLFRVISTVQWSGATSICDGIILFKQNYFRQKDLDDCFYHFHFQFIFGHVLKTASCSSKIAKEPTQTQFKQVVGRM